LLSCVFKDPKVQGTEIKSRAQLFTSAVFGFQHRILQSFPQLRSSSGSAKLQAMARTPLDLNAKQQQQKKEEFDEKQ